MIISTDIDFFNVVYLITDQDQKPRLVTEVKIMPPNTVLFSLSHLTECSWHYRNEFSTEKDQVKKLSNA